MAQMRKTEWVKTAQSMGMTKQTQGHITGSQVQRNITDNTGVQHASGENGMTLSFSNFLVRYL